MWYLKEGLPSVETFECILSSVDEVLAMQALNVRELNDADLGSMTAVDFVKMISPVSLRGIFDFRTTYVSKLDVFGPLSATPHTKN